MKTSTPSHIDLSIIIPALSEEKRIGATLDELAVFLRDDPYFKKKIVEVLVVAADTQDKTHEIVLAKQKLFRSLTLLRPGPVMGKGRDVRYGMLRAHGTASVFMDADLATPLHHLQPFYETCTGGADLVIGTRNLLRYRPNILNNICSYLGNLIYRALSFTWIEDTQCGFKMFDEHARKLCFSKLTIMGWDFDVEVLTIARLHKLSITALRIDDWKDMPYGTHTRNVLRVALRISRDFILVSLNRFKGTYS